VVFPPHDAKPGQVWTNPADGLEYSWIPPGTFAMGCVPNDAECEPQELPRHRVRLTAGYWLGRTEVTVAAFRRFVGETGFRTGAEIDGEGIVWKGDRWAKQDRASWRRPGFTQNVNHPVVMASWVDASSYCHWAGGRLPTDAEWERAARGGREGARYVWGAGRHPRVAGHPQANVPDASAGRAFRWHVFEGYDDGFIYTAPVGSFAPNRFGLHDMAGNAYEWVFDWYAVDYFASSPLENPPGPANGRFRVLRGGSWAYYVKRVRLSARGAVRPGDARANVGFRCAIEEG